MVDAKRLWKQRLSQYFNEIKRYLRYMFNDHLLIAVIILLGGAAFYYRDWLNNLPDHFPYASLIAFILAVVVTNSRIQTLLKEPDLVFLLPVEKQLSTYFQKAFWFSFLSQLYLLLFAFAATAPLYLAATGKSASSLLFIFLLVLLSKIWNLLLTWQIQYYPETSTKYIDTIVRFILNFVLLYLLYSLASIVFIVMVIILMVGLLLYFQSSVKQKGLKWEYLIELESRRMMAFYRIANLFTDVPKLKERVKKRAWINWVTFFIGYSKKSAFSYLYLRTFLRTSDYFGMSVRLTLIGGIVIYYAPFDYIGYSIVTILFLYLTGYQLITLWRHHSIKIWLQLYPIGMTTKIQSFLKLLFIVLFVQSTIFFLILIFMLQITNAIIVFGACILFSYIFIYYYVKNKVMKLV